MEINRYTKKLALTAAITTLSASSFSVSAFAESPIESIDQASTKKEIKQNIRANKKKIRKLKQALQEKNSKRLKRALRLAKKNNWALRQKLQDGRIIEFVDVDDFDQPIYLTTYNVDAADSINTDEVWAHGNAMLNLSGDNITVGVWDGGAVRTSHVEFNRALITDADGNTELRNTGPRAFQRDQSNSDPISISNHATHVAGTIAAGGVRNSARGMANQATIHAYDWNNDDAEMLAEAEDGLLVSNHSYGFVIGWSYRNGGWTWTGNDDVSTEEDFRFGWYSDSSASWDEIAEAAPHYLIVKAAGNDRGDGPRRIGRGQAERDCERDGFDCIGTQGISKNILTIGAVEDITGGYTRPRDVVAASFTSFGPTDDGRIKPDLVANGISVLSAHGTSSDTRYYSISGTSMATPSVSGSLALLQEHYADRNNYHMLAATLKGLAIHTASEAGNSEGPDYRYGWGLMNTEAAANAISNATRNNDSGATNGSLIAELSVTQGDTLTLDLEASDNSPITATIVWSDPAAEPFTQIDEVLDNRTPMLINDLDMVLVENTANGEVRHQPYVMNPYRPNNAATRGDNDRDNVEKIVINNPTAGSTYQLQVSFDSDQADNNTAESFSLIASGVETPSCFAPSNLSVNENDTRERSISVAWDAPIASDGNVFVSFRENGAENWTERRATRSNLPLRIRGLQPGTEYEIRARFACGAGSNVYSTVVTEKTNG